jgi:hypothetical protein
MTLIGGSIWLQGEASGDHFRVLVEIIAQWRRARGQDLWLVFGSILETQTGPIIY